MVKEAQDAPPRETYNYVLTMEGKNPHLPWVFCGYAENKQSVPVRFKEEIIPAIFIDSHTTMMAAWKRGWKDITEEWMEWIESITPKPTTDSQQQIIDHMKIDATEISKGIFEYKWYTKSTVLQATGVAETIWRTAIKTLLERDLVEKTGFGKATKYRLK